LEDKDRYRSRFEAKSILNCPPLAMEGVYEAVKFAIDLLTPFSHFICLLLAEKLPPPKNFI
jgi:hypothetical protein